MGENPLFFICLKTISYLIFPTFPTFPRKKGSTQKKHEKGKSINFYTVVLAVKNQFIFYQFHK